jgi:predicted Zn-dependent protease
MTRRLFLALIVSALFVAACATVPVTGRRQLSLISAPEMAAMGADSYEQFLQESKLSTETRQTTMVQDVGVRISTAAEAFMREHGMAEEIDHYGWEFNLVEADTVVNAFCMPGGKIGVYSGILPVTRDETGLAVVVGHEVAHAIANHGGERMSQLLLVQMGGMALSRAVKEQPEKTQQLLMLAFGIGTNVGVLLPYSRQHESEADRIGLILMARAGYDPRAAVPFWERMNQQGGARPPEFLSTHPAPQRRIEDIKRYLTEALQYYQP